MKRTRIVLFLVLALLLITSASAAAQSTPSRTGNAPAGLNAAAASTRWSSERIDRPTIGNGAARGMFASIAMAGVATYISYYDATTHDLMLAMHRAGDPPANCGPNNTWNCQVIDSTGDVGQYSSIAVPDCMLCTVGAAIAYYDGTNNALKVAQYVCGATPCHWASSRIQSGPTTPVGKYPSIKYDTSGGVHIAYQLIASNGTAFLMYAHSVSGSGNCGEGDATGKWQCDPVDAGTDLGEYASLDLNGSNQPRIAYYDSATPALKYAVYLGTTTGNCGPFGTWWCGKVNYNLDVGRFASMQVNRTTNNAYLAYYDATNGKLRTAHWVGASGNCGEQFLGNTVWWCETIDDMGTGTGMTQAGISLALDAKGYPNIVYKDGSDPIGPAVLKIARPIGALGAATGNCGLSPTWQCDVLDIGSSNTDEGDYASIAFSPSGLAKIAYYESDSYYHTGYLKVLQQLAPVWLPLLRK